MKSSAAREMVPNSDVNSDEVPMGYKRSDLGTIPIDWAASDYLAIGEVIDGDRGNSYPSAGDLRGDGYCLFLNAGNVTKEGFKFKDCQFITSSKDAALRKGKLVRGDVVLTTRGTIGNLAYFSDDVIFEHIRINSGMVILRKTHAAVLGKYLYLVLRSSIIANQIERLSFGSAQPQLTVKGISTLKVPLPPTEKEQEAIAEALSDGDALIESLEQLITKKRAIKQGTMQELLTGKRRLPGFKSEWQTTTLEEASAFITKGSTPTTYGFAWEKSGTLFLRSECVSSHGIDLSESMYISDRAHQMLRRSEVVGNDILMTITGNVGRVIQLAAEFGSANINQHIARIRVTSPVMFGEFVAQVLNQDSYRRYYESILTGQAYPQISLKQVRETKIPAPELKEQTAISSVLSDMDLELAILQAKLSKAKQIKQGMMQELLTGRIRLV